MTEAGLHIIIVAGGTGSRFGGTLPKQYCDLMGRPVLCHTIEKFHTAFPHADLITVVSAAMADYWAELSAAHNTPCCTIVHGGSTRWESVKKAIDAIRPVGDDDIVMVHDGARPLVDIDTIMSVYKSVSPRASVVPVTDVTESLRVVDSKGQSHAVDRSSYRKVVTPQGFMLNDLRQAYSLPYRAEFTDDASVMSAAGMPDTILVDSTPVNIKITHPGDIALAMWHLSNNR